MNLYSISHPGGFSFVKNALKRNCPRSFTMKPGKNGSTPCWLVELENEEAQSLQKEDNGCTVVQKV